MSIDKAFVLDVCPVDTCGWVKATDWSPGCCPYHDVRCESHTYELLPLEDRRSVLVLWQCGDHAEHRGWRDERNEDERGRRGTCDYCLGVTAFEREVSVTTIREDRP